jgi:hypothetical protein
MCEMTGQEALIALFRENAIPMSDRNGVLHDIISAALAEAEKAEPFAYLVVQASGYIVGGWKDRDAAESIAAQQLARDKESVVDVYLHPPRRESADILAMLVVSLRRLCDAADDVGVTHFDTDSLSREVIEMQDATKCARTVLRAAGGEG